MRQLQSRFVTGLLDILNPAFPRFRPSTVTIDADGVLHRGQNVLAGAVELINVLDAHSIPWRIVTNNSRQTPAVAAAHYQHLGLPVDAAHVLTAANALAVYIVAKHVGPGQPLVFSVGDADLENTLRAEGCVLTDDEKAAEYVAVGLNRALTYELLKRGSDAVRRGAHFLCANLDPTIPDETGAVPGVGAIAAAIAVASSRAPINIGKPGPELMWQAIRLMGGTPEAAVHLGDRLDSDVLAARRAGMVAVLVTTGGHTRAEGLATPVAERPDVIASDLPMLLANWFDFPSL